jgi:hypothetical protein
VTSPVVEKGGSSTARRKERRGYDDIAGLLILGSFEDLEEWGHSSGMWREAKDMHYETLRK